MPEPAVVPSEPATLEQYANCVERLAMLLTLDLIEYGRETGYITTLGDLQKFFKWWVKIGGPELRDAANHPGVKAELAVRKNVLISGYFNDRYAIERASKRLHAEYLASKSTDPKKSR